MALGLPLTIQLQKRATAELETNALVTTQGIVTAINPESLTDTRTLKPLVKDASGQTGARVIVVDDSGIVLADSGL
ncbi:MAG TPA: hypothetical protein VIE12_08460, partial [Actinomycetota bacterium]